MKKGFTLIELMIVIAILCLLAAIAIPKFEDLIKKGKKQGVFNSDHKEVKVFESRVDQSYSEKRYDIGKFGYVYEVDIDGCSYLFSSQNYNMVHKGNCTNIRHMVNR